MAVRFVFFFFFYFAKINEFVFSQPSHGDKAANPEVLRWVNELSKLRKDLKGELVLRRRPQICPDISGCICWKAAAAAAPQNTSC